MAFSTTAQPKETEFICVCGYDVKCTTSMHGLTSKCSSSPLPRP